MKAIQQWFISQGYEFVQQIGQGSFGSIFSVHNDEGDFFCVKVEFLDPLEKSYLIHEAHIMKKLQPLLQKEESRSNEYDLDRGHSGVLKFFGYEIIDDIQLSQKPNSQKSSIRESKQFVNMIFMEYGGVSLNQFKQTHKIDEQVWFGMFKKLLIVLQKIHRVGVIHRDLKPQNILIRKKSTIGKVISQKTSSTSEDLLNFEHNYQMFVIDFGLAKMVRKPNKQVFIQKQQGGFAGTVNYASIRAHKGEYQHYADDLEAILYIMLYLGTGTLPWLNIGIKNSVEDRYQTIMISKQHLFERTPDQQDKDTRFSQFSDTLSTNQQKFLRFYSNAIFKQNIGNLYINPNYNLIFKEIAKYYQPPKLEQNDHSQ